MKYRLKRERLGWPAGTIVYRLKNHDYGLARDDTRATGIDHISVTQDPAGGYPSITATYDDLEEIAEAPATTTLPPGPYRFEAGDSADTYRIYAAGDDKPMVEMIYVGGEEGFTAAAQRLARLFAAAPKLLAYAECEAAIACGKADPRYDPKPVIRSHGWNEQTESIGLFLSRIRRMAVEAAAGSYLGRAA